MRLSSTISLAVLARPILLHSPGALSAEPAVWWDRACGGASQLHNPANYSAATWCRRAFHPEKRMIELDDLVEGRKAGIRLFTMAHSLSISAFRLSCGLQLFHGFDEQLRAVLAKHCTQRSHDARHPVRNSSERSLVIGFAIVGGWVIVKNIRCQMQSEDTTRDDKRWVATQESQQSSDDDQPPSGGFGRDHRQLLLQSALQSATCSYRDRHDLIDDASLTNLAAFQSKN